MSDTIKDRLAANIHQVKSTGSKRVESIKKIISEATSQTVAELKEGSSELGETARDTLKTAVSEWKNRETAASDYSPSRVDPSNPGKKIAALFETVKKQPSSEQIRKKLADLDTSLAARYGDRYEALSQKRRQVMEWYSKTLESSEQEGTNPVDVNQVHLHRKASSAGTSVARKEKQIKDYFRTVFKRVDANP
jgi:hypothetical protein